jgi:Fur family transcriptional regulator, peroxide stress response regulator
MGIMGAHKDMKMKMTPQRLAILKFLDKNREHPSAADIYRAVSKDFPTMSFATVYNTLKALKESKNVLELSIDAVKKRYDPDTADHNHLICLECRRIVDVEADIRVDLADEKAGGFTVVGSHVDFYGYCPECRGRRKGKPGVQGIQGQGER